MNNYHPTNPPSNPIQSNLPFNPFTIIHNQIDCTINIPQSQNNNLSFNTYVYHNPSHNLLSNIFQGDTTTMPSISPTTTSTTAPPFGHCASTPCVQGNCVDNDQGFLCLCPDGYQGIRCENQVGELLYNRDNLALLCKIWEVLSN